MTTTLDSLKDDAFDIMAEAEEKLMEIVSDAIDAVHSPKQPVLYTQLVKIYCVYDQLMFHLVFNGVGDEIIAIQGEDVSVMNKLLIQLKKLL